MSINKNGNISTQYKKVHTADIGPWNPEIFWDQTRAKILCTYEENNFGFNPAPGNSSGIGFLRMNNATTSLTGRYYWQSNHDLGTSISFSADSNYIIGASSGNFDSIHFVNPSFLKISATNFNPIQFKRYNLYRTVVNQSIHKKDQGSYVYMLPIATSAVLLQMRLIKADNNLDDCGAEPYPVSQLSYTPVDSIYTYDFLNSTISDSLFLSDHVVNLTSDSCYAAIADHYRHAQAVIATPEATVYPTAISGNEMLNCKISVPGISKAAIVICNTMGQVLYRNAYILQPGENMQQVSTDFLNSGMYLVRLVIDGSVINTTKVSVVR